MDLMESHQDDLVHLVTIRHLHVAVALLLARVLPHHLVDIHHLAKLAKVEGNVLRSQS